MNRSNKLFLFVILASCAVGCASTFEPTPIDDVPFKERAETQTKNGITATFAVLSKEEARAVFDSKLYKKHIQPMWIEVVNDTDEMLVFMPRSVDPFYYSPLEAAQKVMKGNKQAKYAKKSFFYLNQMPFRIPAGETVSGFVFGNTDKGLRWAQIEVFGETRHEFFQFLHEVPGFKADYHKLETDDIYGMLYPDQEIVNIQTPLELREWIESLPCCTENQKGTKQGDPVNLVIIGTSESVWPAFAKSGWDPTAALTTGSALWTGVKGIFGGAWRYSPISELYYFGRGQDIALQKVRSNIHYRNHLRLWIAPVKYQGEGVLMGQISRDIGTRITTKSPTLTTHRIDPDVDETRASLVQDFLFVQAVEAYMRAGGVGEASPEEPRRNLTGDIYFTDGYRAVMILTTEQTGLLDVEMLMPSDEQSEK
jgi:hypothetical protein